MRLKHEKRLGIYRLTQAEEMAGLAYGNHPTVGGYWLEDNPEHRTAEIERVRDTRNSRASSSSAAVLSQFQLSKQLIIHYSFVEFEREREIERERPLHEGIDCFDVSQSPAELHEERNIIRQQKLKYILMKWISRFIK